MHEIPSQYRAYPTDGVLFHIANVYEGMKGGPHGVWIETGYVRQNPVLRTVARNGVIYRFIAKDPMFGVSETSVLAFDFHGEKQD
jgi:hypothetical protein